MKTLLIAGAAAAAAATAIAATASGQSPTAPVTAPAPITVVQSHERFAFVDVPPKGGLRKPPTQGDEYVIRAKLAGTLAGTSNLVCTVTAPGSKGASTCTGTLVFATGAITFAGLSQLATEDDTFAVTGGTGAYVGATGTVHGAQGKGDTTDITVQLR